MLKSSILSSNIDAMDEAIDIRAFGWTSSAWLIHRSKAVLIAVTIFIIITILFATMFQHTGRIRFILGGINVFLALFLFQQISPHIKLSHPSDDSDDRFTGYRAIERLKSNMSAEADRDMQAAPQTYNNKYLQEIARLKKQVSELERSLEDEKKISRANLAASTGVQFMPANNFNNLRYR